MPTAAQDTRVPATDESNLATDSPFPLPASDALRPLVVKAIDSAIRNVFPAKYFGLCHVYAIVGANVAAVVLGREYRPVAGLAVIDAGAGCRIKLLDNAAFGRDIGGAYHCWIESVPAPGESRELIDLIYRHNAAYAKKHKLLWRKKASDHLWGCFDDLVIDAALENLPPSFPENRIWLKETPEGAAWIERQVAAHLDNYVSLTAFALRLLLQSIPNRPSAAPFYSRPDATQNWSALPSRPQCA